MPCTVATFSGDFAKNTFFHMCLAFSFQSEGPPPSPSVARRLREGCESYFLLLYAALGECELNLCCYTQHLVSMGLIFAAIHSTW